MPWIIGIAVVLILLVIVWISISNNLKRATVKIDEAESGIEVALTKRFDMLKKLLDVTKGYAKHEKEVLIETIKMRKGMGVAEMSKASGEMDNAMGRINVLAEAYPELKANENFKQLQLAIMDTEEHLQATRRQYNGNVSAYNMMVVSFPTSIVAAALKFKKRDFFEAEEEKKQDVKMEF
jgi:LemA protein